MANHCSCEIDIYGKKSDIEEIVSRLKFYSTPLNMHEDIVYYGETYYTLFRNKYPHIYDASIDSYHAYGSKWWSIVNYDVNEPDDVNGLYHLYISSYSAWSPVLGVCEKLALDYDCEVSILFNEPGMGFAGEYTYDSTGCIKQNDMDSAEFEVKYEYESFCEYLKDTISDYQSYEEFLKENETKINLIKTKGDEEFLKELANEAEKLFV